MKVIAIVSDGSEGGYYLLGIASDIVKADELLGKFTRENSSSYMGAFHYYEIEVDKDTALYGVAGKEL